MTATQTKGNDFPTLKRELLTAEHGTEEFGKQVTFMNFTWTEEAIIWALEAHITGARTGQHKGGEGMELAWLQKAVHQMAKLADDDLHELMEAEDDECPSVGDWMIRETLRIMLGKEEVVLKDGKLYANFEVEEVEDTRTELDGINYPLVTALSPQQMAELALNEKRFRVQFPNGNLEAVQMTALHLAQGKVTYFSSEIDGKEMFMYELAE